MWLQVSSTLINQDRDAESEILDRVLLKYALCGALFGWDKYDSMMGNVMERLLLAMFQ